MVAPVNVTGNYFQIVGTAVPAGLTPRIRVRTSGPAVTDNEVVAQVWKEFSPASSGSFTLPLIPTSQMRPVGSTASIHYVVEFDAADSAGNFRTSPERYELSVPPGGGEFMALVRQFVAFGQLEVTNDGPRPASEYAPGTIILDTSGEVPFLSVTN